MANQTLDGISVLITRPHQQSTELVAEIESRGGRAILFPSLEIVARDKKTIEKELTELSPADITVFISSNAVEHGVDYADGDIAAVGPATAAAIENAGKNVAILPASGFDSEHLLAETAFADVRGKTIRIIRGSSGREKLAKTLRERGAIVEYLSTYERRLPSYTAAELHDLEQRWRKGDVDAVVVMSVQSLVNLCALLPAWCLGRLSKTPLVTPAARVLKEALIQIPGCSAILAAGPQAGDIVDSLASVTRSCQSASPTPE